MLDLSFSPKLGNDVSRLAGRQLLLFQPFCRAEPGRGDQWRPIPASPGPRRWTRLPFQHLKTMFFFGGGGWTRVVEDVRGFTEFSGWLDPRRPVAYSAGPRLCPWTWPLRNRRWTRISWHQRRPIAFPGRGSFAGGRSSWTSTTTKLNKKKTKRTGVLNEALGFSENILKLKFKMMHTQLSTLFGGKEDSTQLILSSCSCTLALESSSLHLSRKSSTSFSSRAHPARSSSFLLWNWCC